MDDSVIQALMGKFGMSPEVARNQPGGKVQGMRRGPSVHSTNADERSKMRQMIETMEPDEYGETDVLGMGPVSVDEAPTDGMISDAMWKIIQEVDPKDGEGFYKLKGQEAMDTLGLGKDASDLAQFWDKLSEEDRFFIIRALDSNIGGPSDNKQIMDDAIRDRDEEEMETNETEDAIIDQMMKQEAR